MRARETAAWLSVLALGYGFLYLPIAFLMLYSFNASKLVTVWGGFSTRWYAALLDNEALLTAAWLSLGIAAVSATVAVVLGTLAAYGLARRRRFWGRGFLAVTVNAPLVIPDVIFGLALLLLFVSLQQWVGFPDGRGAGTVTIAHITLGMAYVAVVVYARLLGRDKEQEEAAMDLGAGPVGVFIHVTLPALWPALLAGWLLAFTLSLDDLVVASFVSGPGATTLPMYVYSGIRLGVTPEINALATILIAIATSCVALAAFLLRRKRA